MKLIKDILISLDQIICKENEVRRSEGQLGLSKAQITILGQMSLLSNPVISSKIQLVGTMDLDAIVKADLWIEQKLNNLLKQKGLELDPLSNEIWLPEESTYSIFYSSTNIECLLLDPLYALVSKAVKAKEKNRFLINKAIFLYGKELTELIKKYNGDLEYFKKAKSHE